MISIDRQPTDQLFARNPIVFELSTDNYELTPPDLPYVVMAMNSSLAPGSGSILTLIFDGYSLNLIFVASNPGANQLTAYGGGSIDAYTELLRQELSAIPAISANFTVFWDVYNGFRRLFIRRKEARIINSAQHSVLNILLDNAIAEATYRPNFRMVIDLYVEENWRQNDWVKVLNVKHYPDENWSTKVNIAQALLDNMGVDLPSDDVKLCTAINRRWMLEVYEEYGDTPVGWTYDRQTVTGYALKAGIDDAAYTPEYSAVLPINADNEHFLTTQPAGKYVMTDEPTWLTFRIDTEDVPRVNIMCYYSDGSTKGGVIVSSADMSNVGAQQHDVVMVPVGYEQNLLGNREPNKTMTHYDVQLLPPSPGTSPMYAVRRFYVRHKPELYTRYIVYQNSLGGMDTVRMSGKLSTALKVDKDVSERSWKYTDILPKHRVVSYNLTREREHELATAYYPQDMIEALEDLLGSEYVYLIEADGRFTPITVSKGSTDVSNEADDLFSLSIKYSPAYRTDNYSTYAGGRAIINVD